MDFRLLNGRPKATMIERFGGNVLLISPAPKHSKLEFSCIHSCLQYVEKQGWEVGVEHIRKTVRRET